MPTDPSFQSCFLICTGQSRIVANHLAEALDSIDEFSKTVETSYPYMHARVSPHWLISLHRL